MDGLTTSSKFPRSTNKELLAHFSFFNIQGLNPQTVPSKVPNIKELLLDSDTLFIGLTEIWLSNHLEAELQIDGYSLFRSDRLNGKKSKYGRDSGGAALYMKDEI